MTVITDFEIPRTLDGLVARLLAEKPRGPVRVWVFEDRDARAAAAKKLADAGIEAMVFSAYKPLVHFFIEEAPLADYAKVTVRYPVHPQADAKRFVLEAYPLTALAGDTELAFEPLETSDSLPKYEVELTDRQGQTQTRKILAPNRVHADHVGDTLLSPTGWLIIKDQGVSERIETDFEQTYKSVIDAVAAHDFGPEEPLFEELNIRVTLPAHDLPLGWGDEVLSLTEAMHEDIYFSLLELYQTRGGRQRSAIGARPGHIVPQVSTSRGAISARVETRPLYSCEASVPRQPLETATHPIGIDQVRAELAALPGEPIEARSRAGRVVSGLYKEGSDAGVIISGAQHANETTGVVGALRAAKVLAARAESHFALSPVENPDGYALHHRLRAENPRHMHHAGRYTGLGDDVESRGNDPILESMIRREALNRMPAQLHLNLHGYPAHEWTRPLSGYLPLGFELWTIPKGFFLIMRHHEDWGETGRRLIVETTERLAETPGLVDFNRSQIDAYEGHAGPSTTFEVINGIPCWIGMHTAHPIPLTLITEYPDETIYGEDFILGHTAQMNTVLAAYDTWQGMAGAL